MNFLLVTPKTINQAKGLVVVVDVLRAFTTACYLFQNKAQRIIPVKTIEDAYILKKKNPNFVLLGERDGIPVHGFDYGNSPYGIKNVNFMNKTIVMTTSSGTMSLLKIKSAQEIITGSFVNAEAIVKYIKNSKTRIVSFVCTDDKYYDGEDFLCSSYIKSQLKGEKLQFRMIKNYLMHHPLSLRFLKEPLTVHARQDFRLCLELNKFNFVVKFIKNNKNIYLEKV